MDLVSSTLDRYLKHRFNGTDITTSATATTINQHEQHPSPTSLNSSNQEQSVTNKSHEQMNSILPTSHISRTNGTETADDNLNRHHLPSVHLISIRNTQPCCIAFRGDLKFMAAGFEDSHIYLWDFSQDSQLLHLNSDTTNEINQSGIDFDATSTTLLAHSGSIYGLKFVNNDDLMLSCSEDTTIRLWCLKTKCNIMLFRGHNYPIWSIDVSPQGFMFASASMDTTARLWRLDKFTPLRIFCGHDDDVDCVKFHPNEKYVATGSSDTTVRLWSTSDGKMVRLMVGHEAPIVSLSYLPDGKHLASASSDGSIKVWNLTTNSLTSNLSVPASITISFSPEQTFVASCGADCTLSLWQNDNACLEERLKLDFRPKCLNLIKSHFHNEDNLFVITFKDDK